MTQTFPPLSAAHVVVPEGASAGHMPRLRFPEHRVIGPLTGLLALEFVGEGRLRQHDLVRRAVERPFAVLEVEEHADVCCHELLQRLRGFDRFAAQAGLL